MHLGDHRDYIYRLGHNSGHHYFQVQRCVARGYFRWRDRLSLALTSSIAQEMEKHLKQM